MNLDFFSKFKVFRDKYKIVLKNVTENIKIIHHKPPSDIEIISVSPQKTNLRLHILAKFLTS